MKKNRDSLGMCLLVRRHYLFISIGEIWSINVLYGII